MGDRFAQLRQRFPNTIATHTGSIQFAARELGSLGVKQLEPLATALFVTRQYPNTSVSVRAEKLIEIKPHVKFGEAKTAVEKVDAWMAEVSS